MRFHLGPPPLPLADPASPMRFDGTHFNAHVAVWAGIVPMGAVIVLWVLRIGVDDLKALIDAISVWELLGLIAALAVLHEAAHAMCFPSGGRAVGLHWRGGYAWAACMAPMSRDRWLACALAPLLVLTILPLAFAPLFLSGAPLRAAVVISMINAVGAMCDLWFAWRALSIPRDSWLLSRADGFDVLDAR